MLPTCYGGGGLELNGVAWSPESRGSLNMKLIFLYGFHSYYYDLKKHFINVLQTGRGPRALSIGNFQLPLPTCQGHLTARPNHSRLLPSRMRDPKRVLLAAPKLPSGNLLQQKWGTNAVTEINVVLVLIVSYAPDMPHSIPSPFTSLSPQLDYNFLKGLNCFCALHPSST